MRKGNLAFWSLVAVLVIGLGVGLSGCGDIGAPDATTVIATTTTTTTSTSTSTSTTTSTTTSTLPHISGKVVFSGTTDGIKGGVSLQIGGPGIGTLVVTTDADTGYYETPHLAASGTFNISLLVTKEGWTIDGISVNYTGGTKSNQNLVATPESWEILHVGGGSNLNAIMSNEANATMMAVGGGSSIILKASSPYTTWTSVSSPTNEALIAMFGKTENIIVDRLAGMFISTNDGATWDFADLSGMGFPNPLTNEAVSDVELAGMGKVIYVTETGKVIKSPDMTSFYDITPPGGAFINGLGREIMGVDGTIEVVGNNGAAYKTENGGTSWEAFGPATAQDLSQGYIVSGYGYLVSRGGTIFATTDEAATWQEELSGLPYPLNGISLIGDSNTPSVLGGNGLIMRRIY